MPWVKLDLQDPPETAFLVADIGGTHTRAAIKPRGAPVERIHAFKNRDFPGLGALLVEYAAALGETRLIAGALAVASPIAGDRVSLTNLHWDFSIDGLRRQLALNALHVFNDFTAIALALPYLGADQFEQVGSGTPRAGDTLAVLGPGTGLGVAGLVPCGDDWTPVASEGGHATLATATAAEDRLVEALRPKLGHVSAEKLLSGPGIVNLYRGLAQLRGAPPGTPAPEAVTARALDASDPVAVEALAMFFALLGGFAGDVALTLGARGGVYLAGGMLPALLDAFRQSTFRRRFAAKGRFRAYLEAIPTYVITDPYPALTGLAAWLEQHVDG